MKTYVLKTKELDTVDRCILDGLSNGLKQREISNHIKTLGYHPSSLKSVETRIRLLKDAYNAKTNFQLAVVLIKKGIL